MMQVSELTDKNGRLRYHDMVAEFQTCSVTDFLDQVQEPFLVGKELYDRFFPDVLATDEHDEDGVLISDEFTNPHKRRMMVEKRARKMESIFDDIAPPEIEGPADAEVTLIGWGSTYGMIKEAIQQLKDQGVEANQLHLKWIVPFHADQVIKIFSQAKRTIIVENSFSGQFARYIRSETGLSADGHIRKYDGEPFMPHHIADGVKEQLSGKTDRYVPYQEVVV